jgi:hypothetical protein
MSRLHSDLFTLDASFDAVISEITEDGKNTLIRLISSKDNRQYDVSFPNAGIHVGSTAAVAITNNAFVFKLRTPKQ